MSTQLTPINDRSSLAPANGQTALAERPPIGSLADALAKARDRCKAAAKDAVNTHHKYAYASADEIVSTASEALNGSGLGLIPLREELTVTGSGNLQFYALNRVLLLAHSSGESVPLEVRGWPVVPDRGRPLDKAFAIALTSSLAYKLRDLLQMPRGNEGDDVTAQRDTQTPPAPAPQQYAQQTEAPPADPTAAPQAEGECLTEQETVTEADLKGLAELYRQHGRTPEDVKRMQLALGIPALAKAPRSRLAWLEQAVTTGFPPAAAVDRINALREELKIDPAAFSARLLTVYGVSSVAHLLPAQADEVETKLTLKLEPMKQRTATVNT